MGNKNKTRSHSLVCVSVNTKRLSVYFKCSAVVLGKLPLKKEEQTLFICLLVLSLGRMLRKSLTFLLRVCSWYLSSINRYGC